MITPNGTTTISVDNVAYGVFEYLEAACRTAEIAFDRQNGGDYTTQSRIAYFRPRQPFVELPTDRAGKSLRRPRVSRPLVWILLSFGGSSSQPGLPYASHCAD